MAITGNKRLLFVDDESSIRATLPSLLQRHGFRVQTAATVPEAIAEIEKKQFDLLLCDLNISEPTDGYSVADAMHRANPKAAIVILTGYPDLENAVEGIHRNIDDYLIKPVDVEKLIAVLNRISHGGNPKRVFSRF